MCSDLAIIVPGDIPQNLIHLLLSHILFLSEPEKCLKQYLRIPSDPYQF